MTLKQELFIKQLPFNKYNVSKTMKQVGYSKQTSISGTQYKRLREITRKKFEFDTEKTKKKIISAQTQFKKQKDNTNYARMIELEARISIPELRRQEITQTNPDKIIISYNNKQSSDVNNNTSDDRVTPTENINSNDTATGSKVT